MHNTITTAEVAVLTTLADTTQRRRWDVEGIALKTGLAERAIHYAIHELERRNYITRMFSARTRQWAITTIGETVLAREAA